MTAFELPSVYQTSVLRDGWRVLISGPATAAATLGYSRTLPAVGGSMLLGCADAFELIGIADTGTSAFQIQLNCISPVFETSTTTPVTVTQPGYMILGLGTAKASTAGSGTIGANMAADLAASGGGLLLSTYKYHTLDFTAKQTEMTASAVIEPAYVVCSTIRGCTHVHCAITTVTGGTNAAVLIRRRRGEALNCSV